MRGLSGEGSGSEWPAEAAVHPFTKAREGEEGLESELLLTSFCRQFDGSNPMSFSDLGFKKLKF